MTNKNEGIDTSTVEHTPTAENANHDMPASKNTDTPTSTLVHQPTDQDWLNYIEDMTLEMKEIADGAGFETLSGILDIAWREARLRKAG